MPFELKKLFVFAIKSQRNPAQLTIITILLDIEDLKAISILYNPDVVCLLRRLASAIDRVDSDIFRILSLARMDDYCHMNIELDADVSQLRHQSILKLKLFIAFALFRKHKLKSVQNDYMDVMLFYRINDGRKDLLDISRPVKVHQVQGHFLEFLSIIVEFLDVFGKIYVGKLVQHVSD